MLCDFWDACIKFQACSCYAPRDDFVSPDSVFESWVLVAPESGAFEWNSRSKVRGRMSGHAAFGDIVCIAPGMPFNRHVTERMSYIVLQWHFQDGRGQSVPVEWPFGQSHVGDTLRLQTIIEHVRALEGRNDGWSSRRLGHLLEELLHLAWQTRQEHEVHDPEMRLAELLLRKRAGENFSMAEISSAYGLGPVQFTRRFRAAHGYNPIELLTQIRLEKARKLLVESSRTLDEIAGECGWASGAYLSSVFKRHLCQSPGEFRRKHRV